jgi:multiple sugar transport system ATP-binding protein
MAEVRLSSIVKKYGSNTVVDQVSLSVEDKEFLVLVGPSGCGKTTTLRMIAGLEEVTDGEIYIGDQDVTDAHPKDRDVAMVFQNYALYPHMNVYTNMAFGLRLKKYPKQEIDARVKDVAAILGIDHLLRRKPKQLSGGERQRVAMGRAIVRKPRAFLFDEPLSNLDAKLRVVMRGELSKLHEKLETTIIYVTHDQIEAMTLADRIVVMNEGRISQIGDPMEVYNNPTNIFVAGFIGNPAMNFIDVQVAEESGKLCVKNNGIKLVIPERLRSRYAKARDNEAILGIRSEHIYDKRIKGNFEGGQPLNCIVEVVEPIGKEIILLASSGGIQLTACVDLQTKVKTHEPITFLVDMANMHLFRKDSGLAY